MPYTDETIALVQDLTANNQKQIVRILTPIFDGGAPYRRKDSYTVKVRALTGGDNVYVLLYKDQDSTPIDLGVINSSTLTETLFDISYAVGVCKSWQIELVGLVSDFNLVSIAVLYGNRPEQVTFYRHLIDGLGPNKKRIRVWPIVIDTLGYDVSVVPYVDNVAQPELVINSSYPETFLYQFKTDVFGIDYAMTLSGCGPFELFDIDHPTGVQILPIAKQYDQVGSEELFRYGKIYSFHTRIQAFGGTSIPFTIYFQDATKWAGNLTVVSGVEDTIMVKVPKTVAGEILRIEYGPTDFNFHRFYTTVQVAKSGADTELKWLPLVSDWEKKLES